MLFWHLLPTVRNGLGIFIKPAVFTLIVLLLWKLARRFVPASTPRTVVSRVTTPTRAPAAEAKAAKPSTSHG
jgi:hypothetical protein